MAGGRQFRRDAFSLWLEAPLVIAMRCQEMGFAAMTGSTQNTTEMTRMVTEKMAAATESVVAANFALAKAMMTASPPERTARAVTEAALKPYGKRVRSNVRRLAKKKS
ncbi:hypothetical protein MUO32_12245 [Shinella sp. CPCC 101442]|uniref:hypothetical protein n=1 Tax=Shinella sp. CPCC 101442 TaxID=2932265 RepID=UPI002152A788|nr:hypothetical protein [Shinella sp. CPCC 101442]MCR6499811.1 hypothetical protein [Shinella sp. CPCC 101442]